MRFECNGQQFRFWCDVDEYSWQLCRGHIDSLDDEENYRIRRSDEFSYGVLKLSTQEYVMVANVINL